MRPGRGLRKRAASPGVPDYDLLFSPLKFSEVENPFVAEEKQPQGPSRRVRAQDDNPVAQDDKLETGESRFKRRMGVSDHSGRAAVAGVAFVMRSLQCMQGWALFPEKTLNRLEPMRRSTLCPQKRKKAGLPEFAAESRNSEKFCPLFLV
jgi:hypothetical protein